jgi:hypothetical protein
MPQRDVIGYYRTVFSTKVGRAVLVDILNDLGVFGITTTTGEDVVLRNYGTKLMHIIGGGGVDINTFEDFAYKLMKQPINEDN